MQSIRIQPLVNGSTLLVAVTCDCGNSILTNKTTRKFDFNHQITMRADNDDKILICGCGKKYRLHPQGNHIHVFSE